MEVVPGHSGIPRCRRSPVVLTKFPPARSPDRASPTPDPSLRSGDGSFQAGQVRITQPNQWVPTATKASARGKRRYRQQQGKDLCDSRRPLRVAHPEGKLASAMTNEGNFILAGHGPRGKHPRCDEAFGNVASTQSPRAESTEPRSASTTEGTDTWLIARSGSLRP